MKNLLHNPTPFVFICILIGLGLFLPSNLVASGYILGSGDKIRVKVFDHDDLTGEFTIDGEGRFPMPLVGATKAKGLTPAELETKIIAALKPDYLLNPRVSVEVLNFRPIYIIGEVKDPGPYPYRDGMTYLNAVAIAGGYTYRAVKDKAYVIRVHSDTNEEIKVQMEDLVQPGDTIRLDERFF